MISINQQENLKFQFGIQNYHLKIHENYFSLENSLECTLEKITEISKSAKFLPIISKSSDEKSYFFTVVPFLFPEGVIGNCLSKIDLKDYFTKEEIENMFNHFVFRPRLDIHDKDTWKDINYFRKSVQKGLNKAISEILFKFSVKDLPIVEIGTGIGYQLHEKISQSLIQTQKSKEECFQVFKNHLQNIYQLDIDTMIATLSKINKKVSLFFAVNVFDTIDSSKRIEYFSKLSTLQNMGDRLLLILDTNPYLDVILDEIEESYPNHHVWPYFSKGGAYEKLSVVLLPPEAKKQKLSRYQFIHLLREQSLKLSEGVSLRIFNNLVKLKKELNLEVIPLEDFFLSKVKCDLEDSGYSSKSYYHQAFEVANKLDDHNPIKQPLVYKFVTDVFNLRRWDPSDEVFKEINREKNLPDIDYISQKNYQNYLKEKNQFLQGAEILVVEAIKRI